MYYYSQKTGLYQKDTTPITVGYSGNGPWKNDPKSQSVHLKGPIPRGLYKMVELIDQHQTCGHYFIRLAPHLDNQMFGRDGFGIHGDKINQPPGNASDGCIVLPLQVRIDTWASGDRDLEVIE